MPQPDWEPGQGLWVPLKHFLSVLPPAAGEGPRAPHPPLTWRSVPFTQKPGVSAEHIRGAQ